MILLVRVSRNYIDISRSLYIRHISSIIYIILARFYRSYSGRFHRNQGFIISFLGLLVSDTLKLSLYLIKCLCRLVATYIVLWSSGGSWLYNSRLVYIYDTYRSGLNYNWLWHVSITNSWRRILVYLIILIVIIGLYSSN